MGKYVQVKDANWRIPYRGGWCLQYVREAFGIKAVHPDATKAWKAKDFYQHKGQPPKGITVPVFFSLGSTKQGHVAIRLDDLMVASSTQAGRHSKGYLHKNINDLIKLYAKYNEGCTYLGWKEGINGVRVVRYEPTITTKDIKTSTVIPFKTTDIETDTLPKGEKVVSTKGVNGTKTTTTRITYSDGKETGRKVIAETSVKPINEVTSIGTYVAPIKPEKPVEPAPEEPEVTLPQQDNWLLSLIVAIIQWVRGLK